MTGQQTRPAVESAPAAMVWVVRIGVTLFLIPFFVVGFGLLLAGPAFGDLGWLGSLVGLPFIAVPGIMLVAVWISPRKTGHGQIAPVNESKTVAESEPVPSVPPTMCTYCGAPRPVEALRCGSCGGT